VLNQNDLPKRMQMVDAFLNKEVTMMMEAEKKRMAARKNFRDRFGGSNDQGSDEINELSKKLDDLGLPEETKKITENEIKKLK